MFGGVLFGWFLFYVCVFFKLVSINPNVDNIEGPLGLFLKHS